MRSLTGRLDRIERRLDVAKAAACYTNRKKPQDMKVDSTVTTVGIEPVILRQPIPANIAKRLTGG